MQSTAAIDWNGCLPFTGPEAALPTGIAHLPKGINVLDLLLPDSIKRTRSGGVLSVKIDEDTYKELVETYGSGQILIATANGKGLTREAWYEQMGKSDGLKLAIIRELNKPQDSPGTFEVGGA